MHRHFIGSFIIKFLIWIISINAVVSQGTYEGDTCTISGNMGTCRLLRSCPPAVAALRRGQPPTVCSYRGFDPIVCCVASETTPPASSACPALPADALRVKKNGQKAWDKCIELADVIHPCERSVSTAAGNVQLRGNICRHSAAELIIGGVQAKKDEFPHMALLGFENTELSAISWDCGGSLISDQWVLTAAHCLWDRKTNSNVKHVRLGGGDVDTQAPPEFLYTVIKLEAHPNYIGSRVYNDIALLQLDRKVKFSESVVPACIHVGNNVKDNKVIATGWGLIKARGDRSQTLLKVTLEKFDYEECSTKYTKDRKSPQGVLNSTQICYGSKNETKDTCQGDSGGPLQIYNLDVACTYTVIGITSVGKSCGTPGLPAIYTRISAFIPWIENIVWP